MTARVQAEHSHALSCSMSWELDSDDGLTSGITEAAGSTKRQILLKTSCSRTRAPALQLATTCLHTQKCTPQALPHPPIRAERVPTHNKLLQPSALKVVL